jgi:hypothetical protein
MVKETAFFFYRHSPSARNLSSELTKSSLTEASLVITLDPEHNHS